MALTPNLFERAFELARSGDYRTVDEVRRKLVQEKYEQVDAHLSGPLIRRQLRQACRQARPARRTTAEPAAE